MARAGKILFVLLFVCRLSYAQQQDVVYLIMTTRNANDYEGINKVQLNKEQLDNYGSILFKLISRNRGFLVPFIHVNYNLAELSKIRKPRSDDQMEIRTILSFSVNDYNPVDLDVLFPTWTKEQAKAFYESIRKKKIYIIDKSTGKKIAFFYTYQMYQVDHASPPEF